MYIDTGTNTLNIHFYAYGGERNVINKTLGNEIFHASGKAKNDMDVLRPTIQVKIPHIEQGGDYKTDFNYAYIDEFDRYYFVVSVILGSEMVATIQLEVDPLESFKDGILSNSAYVERNEFDFDAFQEDASLPLSLEKEVFEFAITNKTNLINTTFDFSYDLNKQTRNFTIASASIGGAYIDVSNNPTGLMPISTILTGDCGGQSIYALSYNGVISLIGSLMGEHSAYATFFKSLVAYPFEVDISNDADVQVSIFKEDANGNFSPVTLGATGRYAPSSSSYRIIADFYMPTPLDFLDLSPYTHYELYIPLYGWHELEYNADIKGHRILVYYSVTYENGSGEVYVYDYTAKRNLFSAPCQVGIPLSLTSTNSQELATQKNAMQNNLVLGLIGSGIGIIGGIATGQYIGAIGSGLAAVNTITNYANQNSMMFVKAQSTHNGSAGGYYSYNEVHLRMTQTKKNPHVDYVSFAHQFGRPLRQVRLLSTLRGFTLVPNIHLEGMRGDCYEIEKQMIIESLREGVIIK